MKVCGIVAEYNPFHKGHKYQIQKTKEILDCDVMIAVMSGNFTQRGEPAVINKWKRAVAACQNGIDIVIELPYIYSTQSAAKFSHGAISLLKMMKITHLSFGSECGNLENLLEIADTPINPDHLHQSMSQGMSFPKAYSLLTTEMMPNDILAVSYLKEIQDTTIEPILIKRTSNYLDDTLQEVSSALAIRKALKQNEDLLDTTPMQEELEQAFHPWIERYYPYLRTLLLTADAEQLSQHFLFNEGIENHLIRQAKVSENFDEFLKNCVNWRYTASRIRRTCLQAMNQIRNSDVQKLPALDRPRVLAFNDKGRSYLKTLKKQNILYASRFAEVPYPWRKMELKTTMLYTSVFPEEMRNEIISKEIGGALSMK